MGVSKSESAHYININIYADTSSFLQYMPISKIRITLHIVRINLKISRHSHHATHLLPLLSSSMYVDRGGVIVLTNQSHTTVMACAAQIMQFLSVVHPRTRTVYLTRHGQSEYNLQKKIGGNSSVIK